MSLANECKNCDLTSANVEEIDSNNSDARNDSKCDNVSTKRCEKKIIKNVKRKEEEEREHEKIT